MIVADQGSHPVGRTVVIPVLYDGARPSRRGRRLKLSPRRGDRAAQLGRVRRLRDRFSARVSVRRLSPPCSGRPVRRRDSPRLRVPAGSVAIVGRQTAIYPGRSPGGWHLLGTTPLCIADPNAGYFPIRAGDRIRFEPISASEFEARRHERLSQRAVG